MAAVAGTTIARRADASASRPRPAAPSSIAATSESRADTAGCVIGAPRPRSTAGRSPEGTPPGLGRPGARAAFGHHERLAASASSSLPWMPPSRRCSCTARDRPAGAAANDAFATNSSSLSLTKASLPIGASASCASQVQPAAVAERGGRFPPERPWQLGLHRAELHRVWSAARRPRGCAASRPCGAGPFTPWVRMAVGVCAKSSYTFTPPASPRSSRRPAHVDEARQCLARHVRRDGLRARAAAIAASALSWLCSPSSAHSTRATFRLASQHVERMRFAARTQRARLLLARAETRDFAPAAHREHALQALFTRVHDEPAARRHGAHQVMELALDRREGSSKMSAWSYSRLFSNRGARPVVHELAALVEERGVVFVGLDHERADAQSVRTRRSSAHAADEEARLQNRRVRGSTPASRSSWSCRVCRPPRARGGPAARGQRAIEGRWVYGAPGVEDRFHQRVAARHDVADDVEVGFDRELLGTEAFDQLDAERAQAGRSSVG